MKIALLVLVGVIVLAVVAYLLLFPRDTFITISFPDLAAARSLFPALEFRLSPHQTTTPRRIRPYRGVCVALGLCLRTNSSSCTCSQPDGKRGFGFSARDGVVEAGLTVEWRQGGAERGDYSRILQVARHRAPTA